MRRPSPAILILSQVYVPDPASTGQHMADVAVALRRRGQRVVVLTSARGYDDATRRYPAREVRDGVEIRRISFASFGKGSLAARLAGAASFLLQALVRGLFVRPLAGILVNTAPPMGVAAALGIAVLRRAPIHFWVLDINPDQAVALGKVRPNSLAARALDALNRVALRHAQNVVTLDRYMAERLARKADVGDRLAVLPPWSHNDPQRTVRRGDNPFRREHDLDGKLVFLYSGNHSPSHPLTTLIAAAARVQDVESVVFAFVGSGSGKREVDAAIAAGAGNVRSLPYQPLERIAWSLAAGDVHLVTCGDPMVGIVHPCKVYGAMAAGRPLLFVGPQRNHVTDLVRRHDIGWIHRHGDVDAVERTVRAIAAGEAGDLEAMGARARNAAAPYAKAVLCARFCDLVLGGPATRDQELARVGEHARPTAGYADSRR